MDKDKQHDLIEDGFGSSAPAVCPECGCKSMYVNRPGDIRCGVCYDRNPKEMYKLSIANREAVEKLGMKFHTIERTFAKMTYETSPINTNWESLSESFRNLYLQDAISFLPSLIEPGE